MAVQTANIKKDDFRENGDDIAIPKVKNPFDLKNLLLNADTEFSSMTNVSEAVFRAVEPGVPADEEAKDSREKREKITDLAIALTQQRLEKAAQNAQTGWQGADLNRRTPKDTGHKPRADNDDYSEPKTPVKENDKRPSPHKQTFNEKSGASVLDTVSNSAGVALDYTRDKAGDLVETVVNKETRQWGGKVLRGEFGAAVEQVAGKETREALREVKNTAGAVVNNIASEARTTFNAASSNIVAAKDAVVGGVSHAVSTVTKGVSAYLPW